MSFLQRTTAPTERGSPGGPVTGVLGQLEAVREYMTAATYPDGAPRELATFTVFCEDGVVKVCMSDRDQARTLWRSGRSIEDALLAVEAAIQDGTADWRKAASRPSGKGGGGRR